MREIRVLLALFLHELILIPYGNHCRLSSVPPFRRSTQLAFERGTSDLASWRPIVDRYATRGGSRHFANRPTAARIILSCLLQVFAASLASCWPREWGALRFRGSKHGYDSIDGMRTHACLRFQ